jgi:hypothetical protein
MADMFGQDTVFGGAFKANLAKMTFSGDGASDGGLGVLVQNVRSDYRQQVSRLWELGNGSKTYFVVGRSMGDLTVARIVGPAAIAIDFVTKFSNPCSVDKNTIHINPTPGYCAPGGNGLVANGVAFIGRLYHNCLITSLALQLAAADMLIQEQVALMFTSLESGT